MPSGAERRRHRRYGLALEVQVREKKQTTPIATATKDISATGIYFTLSEGTKVGAEIEFELKLPPELCRGKPVEIRCHGRIVRVEQADGNGKIGVAATIDEYEFLRHD